METSQSQGPDNINPTPSTNSINSPGNGDLLKTTPETPKKNFKPIIIGSVAVLLLGLGYYFFSGGGFQGSIRLKEQNMEALQKCVKNIPENGLEENSVYRLGLNNDCTVEFASTDDSKAKIFWNKITEVKIDNDNPLTITITSDNNLEDQNLTWDLGDGTVLKNRTGKVMTHTYSNPGKYLVKVSSSIKNRSKSSEITAGKYIQVEQTILAPAIINSKDIREIPTEPTKDIRAGEDSRIISPERETEAEPEEPAKESTNEKNKNGEAEANLNSSPINSEPVLTSNEFKVIHTAQANITCEQLPGTLEVKCTPYTADIKYSDIAGVNWGFGENGTYIEGNYTGENIQSKNYTYANSGSYDIELIIEFNNGSITKGTFTTNVEPIPPKDIRDGEDSRIISPERETEAEPAGDDNKRGTNLINALFANVYYSAVVKSNDLINAITVSLVEDDFEDGIVIVTYDLEQTAENAVQIRFGGKQWEFDANVTESEAQPGKRNVQEETKTAETDQKTAEETKNERIDDKTDEIRIFSNQQKREAEVAHVTSKVAEQEAELKNIDTRIAEVETIIKKNERTITDAKESNDVNVKERAKEAKAEAEEALKLAKKAKNKTETSKKAAEGEQQALEEKNKAEEKVEKAEQEVKEKDKEAEKTGDENTKQNAKNAHKNADDAKAELAKTTIKHDKARQKAETEKTASKDARTIAEKHVDAAKSQQGKVEQEGREHTKDAADAEAQVAKVSVEPVERDEPAEPEESAEPVERDEPAEPERDSAERTTDSSTDSRSRSDEGIARFAENKTPEIKTGRITLEKVLRTKKFECLDGVKNPANFKDNKDETVKLLASIEFEGQAIIKGFIENGESIFGGELYTNRAEILKTLILSSCTPSNLNLDNVSLFKDVKTTDWYRPFVGSARKLNIIDGFSDNTYRPAQRVTRIEAIKMMARIAGINKNSCEEAPFIDVDENHWGYEISRDAYCNNISAGKIIGGKRYLLPDEPMTRNEMAVFIYNYYVSETD